MSKTFTDFIPKYKKEKEEEIKLNDDNIKNKLFEEDNKKSKENLNITNQKQTNEIDKLIPDLDKYKKNNEQLKLDLDKYKKENEQLKLNLNKCKTENEKLKSDLLKAEKIISNIKNNQTNNSELKALRDENNKLKYKLTLKEKEIRDLKDKIQNNIKNEKKVDYNDIIVINFVSIDSSVQCGIKCLPTDTFAEVEEKLYKKFDNLRDTNNMFIANAKPILRFKKICENNIKDGDTLQLHKIV